MGCLVAEIVMLVYGIVALATGKIQLAGSKVVRGAAARWIGVVLMLPLPLAFVGGAIGGVILAARGQRFEVGKVPTWAVVLEATIFVLCLGTAFLI